MKLEHVKISHGRLIPEGTEYSEERNRGINVHGRIGKFFADTFGSGTINVTIDNQEHYLNKASCYKLIAGKSGKVDRSSQSYQDLMGDDEKVIAAVQKAFHATRSAPVQTPPTVFTEKQKENWNDLYKTSDKFSFEDPLFNLIADISPESYGEVCGKWQNLDWFKRLEPETREKFKKFISNIQNLTIDRQNEVFRTEDAKKNAYALFQKGIIYLYNRVHDNPELGQSTVLQLNLAVGECPAAYLSFIRTAIHAVADQSIAKDETCEKGFHEIYSQYRRKIAEEMASKFGRKETHTLNSILHLIGEERQIPGYQIVIEDKQMDIQGSERSKLLNYFDKENSPEKLISWIYKKLHGEIDEKWWLFGEIQDHLAAHFNVDRIALLPLITDEDEKGNIKFKPEAVIACLELFEIIVPIKKDKSATHLLQTQVESLG